MSKFHHIMEWRQIYSRLQKQFKTPFVRSALPGQNFLESLVISNFLFFWGGYLEFHVDHFWFWNRDGANWIWTKSRTSRRCCAHIPNPTIFFRFNKPVKPWIISSNEILFWFWIVGIEDKVLTVFIWMLNCWIEEIRWDWFDSYEEDISRNSSRRRILSEVDLEQRVISLQATVVELTKQLSDAGVGFMGRRWGTRRLLAHFNGISETRFK